jgi:UDP-N-acetylmuramoyl-L-alanyl-D-glutamate--2,6-diaminopimelate ligase
LASLLSHLLTAITPTQVHGTTDKAIEQICTDSRMANPHTLFIAVKGTQTDGHQYITAAIERGAVAVLCETLPQNLHNDITYIVSKQVARDIGLLADIFYDSPSAHLRLVGVTGTNGKTTTATLLFRLFRALGYGVGLVSTIQYQINDTIFPSSHTTPDALHFHRLLAQMREAGCQFVFAEVSSHAVVQERISGLRFAGGIFTNITHDHLDYHGTFANYIKAKKGFFDQLPANSFALVNIDDKHGRVMVQNTRAKIYAYSLQALADFKGRILENTFEGLHLYINQQEIYAQLIGSFNAANLLAVYGTAVLLGEDSTTILTHLSALQTAEGRFDCLVSPQQKIVGIVDYAHTPDALEKVLVTIRHIARPNQKVICVVGCGGDRDRSKRPIMAATAAQYSDRAILTSDNPRSENPDQIIAEMQIGVPTDQKSSVLSITNRLEAIRTAVALAQTGDVVLVAGKGHEKYQETNGVKMPFDDKAILGELLQHL